MAGLVPVENKNPESIFGFLKGHIKTTGDIVSPMIGPGEWFDRIFAATALVAGAELITADAGIRRAAAVRTVW